MRENDKEGVAKEEKRDIVGNAFQVPRNIGEKKPPKPEDKPSNDDDQSSDG